jgi:hypothetical protein
LDATDRAYGKWELVLLPEPLPDHVIGVPLGKARLDGREHVRVLFEPDLNIVAPRALRLGKLVE